jgi:hypothetical protein
LAGQYGVQDQKKRAAGRASHGRIAGQVGGWLHAAAYRCIECARH